MPASVLASESAPEPAVRTMPGCIPGAKPVVFTIPTDNYNDNKGLLGIIGDKSTIILKNKDDLTHNVNVYRTVEDCRTYDECIKNINKELSLFGKKIEDPEISMTVIGTLDSEIKEVEREIEGKVSGDDDYDELKSNIAFLEEKRMLLFEETTRYDKDRYDDMDNAIGNKVTTKYDFLYQDPFNPSNNELIPAGTPCKVIDCANINSIEHKVLVYIDSKNIFLTLPITDIIIDQERLQEEENELDTLMIDR